MGAKLFHEDGRTYGHEKVDFRNFAKVPKKGQYPWDIDYKGLYGCRILHFLMCSLNFNFTLRSFYTRGKNSGRYSSDKKLSGYLSWTGSDDEWKTLYGI
jgi:hypothetical protein